MNIRRENAKMVGKLAVITVGMFAFGYALIPIYKHICELTGINILSLSERQVPGNGVALLTWLLLNKTRLGLFVRAVTQNRRMAAQAIPSYAPRQAAAHFNKLECFCFNQYILEPGEKKQWPVAFVIDPRLSKDVTTITLSYTFFEVGGKTPPAPESTAAASLHPVKEGS
ncbi:MAG: cytochrome C oxidase assembly protein [Acidovorax sp. 32-64-7]|nr:MAG: cytochrome C oxidase assembly protein [Acidovorax sp. 32-64-7]